MKYPAFLQTKIRAGIELWTNPGDVVLSPFGGIGSEGYVAVKQGRKAIVIELKESYYKQACLNLHNAAHEAQQDTLFGSPGHRMSDDQLRVLGTQDHCIEMALERAE